MPVAMKPTTDRLAAACDAAHRIGERFKGGHRTNGAASRPQLRLDEAEPDVFAVPAAAAAPVAAPVAPGVRLIASPELEEHLITVEVVNVTPAIATEWLKENVQNRGLNPRTVQRYATAMKRGRWRLNGEPVIFDRTGRLRNGQHRLTGCLISGASFATLVVRGVEPETFETMDTGKGRSGGDVLGLLGHTHAACRSAVCTLLVRYRAGELPVRNGNRKIEHYEIREMSDANPGIHDSILAAAPAGRLASPSVLAFCHLVFGEIDAGLRDEFFAKLSGGAGMEEGDPVLALRNRLIKNRGTKAKLGGMDLIALIFKAFRHARDGQRVGRQGLSWRSTGPSPEPFPKID